MSAPRVLDGVRVLDLSQGAAGPIAGMILGDHGAEVVKVDPPGGEWGRKLGPPFVGEDAAAYFAMNRNKRSIAIDLKHREGAAVARALARRCDVLIESFRPGVLERLGLGHASLSSDDPRLVYCSISAFGQSGPWRDKPGVDGVVQAMSGIMSVTGEPDGSPVKVGVPAADTMGAMAAVQGVLLALLARERTGRGQRVEVSLIDAMLMFQTVPLSMFLASGASPGRHGSAAPYSAPNEAFPTADGHVMVAAYWPDRWTALLELLGCPELGEDPRFATGAARVENRSAMGVELAARFRRRTTAEWLVALEAVDVLCAPINDYHALAADDWLMAGDRFPRLVHPELGAVPGVATAARLSESPARPEKAAPLVGEHTTEILCELGLDAARIEELVGSGAVVQRRRGDQSGPGAPVGAFEGRQPEEPARGPSRRDPRKKEVRHG